MEPTHLLYLENFNLLKHEAKIVDTGSDEGKEYIILDATVFYAQGGGQPSDQGYIIGAKGKFKIENVKFLNGIVKHYGMYETGQLEKDDMVICEVDTERRKLHSKLHSGGHIVDMAIHELQLPWIPGKGYHFPDGPYVEYAGTLENIDKEVFKTKIETIAERLIKESWTTKLVFMDKDKMSEACHHVPEYLPAGKPARVVLYEHGTQTFGVPCGGTHVNNLGEIGGLTIRKIKADGPNIRIGYNIN